MHDPHNNAIRTRSTRAQLSHIQPNVYLPEETAQQPARALRGTCRRARRRLSTFAEVLVVVRHLDPGDTEAVLAPFGDCVGPRVGVLADVGTTGEIGIDVEVERSRGPVASRLGIAFSCRVLRAGDSLVVDVVSGLELVASSQGESRLRDGVGSAAIRAAL